MVSVYAGGHISGGHYNPAVILAAAVRGRLDWVGLVGYWAAQIVGALAAALAAEYIVRPASAHSASPVVDFGPVFVAEWVFTFVLAFVVLNVATSEDHPDNSFYGLAIGFTVFVGAVAVGPISGGAFNPAVAVGGSVLGLFAWQSLWLYVVANLLGCSSGRAYASGTIHTASAAGLPSSMGSSPAWSSVIVMVPAKSRRRSTATLASSARPTESK